VPSADDLAAVPLFEALSDADRHEVAAWCADKTVEAGSRLIGQGAPGYLFFILTEGTADVTRGATTVAQLGPGDFFGAIAIMGGGRRSASVITTSQAKLLVMFGSEFRRLQEAQPAIAARIEEAMHQRLAPDPGPA
jgi:CRP-like cAMP-binding protein